MYTLKKPIKIFIGFASIAATLISLAIAYFNISYANKIFPRIYINGENYSEITTAEANSKLENKINNIYSKGLVFAYQDKIYAPSFSQAGIIIDKNKTIAEAFDYGHRKNALQNLKEQAGLLANNVDFEIEFSLEEEKLENYILENLQDIENPPRSFYYVYSDGKFIPFQAESGIVINREILKENILANIRELKNEPIKLELAKKEAGAKEDFEERALAKAKNLLNKKVIFHYNSSSWEVQKEDLAQWIEFAEEDGSAGKNMLGIKADEDKIQDYLFSLVPQINREPVNAQFVPKDGKIEVFSLDQEGIALQIKESAGAVAKAVFVLENYQDNAEKNIEIQLMVEKVKPEITIESIDNMGITKLLATGESNFAGSPKNRKHNIAVGAGKFNGVLIGPSDEFSFVKILGNVGPKEGYLPELVIKQGRTTPEYGGGLCQVSTTTFRAAVKAGLEITERKNHAYPVKYYNPQGTDATIYPPHPDLRFKNNTPAYILIQTRVEGNNLYFDFYGSDDGRKVELQGPVVYDKKSNGSMKATWVQQVYNKEGNLWFEKKFYSSYNSPALYPHKNPLE